MNRIDDRKWIYDRMRDLVNVLDPSVYPETAEYLKGLLEDQDDYMEDAFDIASALCMCDKPTVWIQEEIRYITDLYMYEIEKENADAMNDLGAQYYDGNRGFEQSFEKAVKYYKMAAERGERQAQENLGYCYYYGRDGEPDYEKAFNYFAMGAFDGHLVSLYKIGDMYYNGYYVEKNMKEAYAIYMRCLDTMTEFAERFVAGPVNLRLGRMYLNGYGTEKDLKSALICFQKAEGYLYSMVVEDGNYMYKKSLNDAIKGQEMARAELMKEMPERDWVFDK